MAASFDHGLDDSLAMSQAAKPQRDFLGFLDMETQGQVHR